MQNSQTEPKTSSETNTKESTWDDDRADLIPIDKISPKIFSRYSQGVKRVRASHYFATTQPSPSNHHNKARIKEASLFNELHCRQRGGWWLGCEEQKVD